MKEESLKELLRQFFDKYKSSNSTDNQALSLQLYHGKRKLFQQINEQIQQNYNMVYNFYDKSEIMRMSSKLERDIT